MIVALRLLVLATVVMLPIRVGWPWGWIGAGGFVFLYGWFHPLRRPPMMGPLDSLRVQKKDSVTITFGKVTLADEVYMRDQVANYIEVMADHGLVGISVHRVEDQDCFYGETTVEYKIIARAGPRTVLLPSPFGDAVAAAKDRRAQQDAESLLQDSSSPTVVPIRPVWDDPPTKEDA